MAGFNDFVICYQITRRYQNAHAYVNAAFLLKVDNGKITEQPRIVYGGITPDFVSVCCQFIHISHFCDQTCKI